MSYLRKIAVTVDETDPGSFVWLLMEYKHETQTYSQVAAAEEPFATYIHALEGGVRELKRQVDYRRGPRHAVPA